jgi:hypothetical protein
MDQRYDTSAVEVEGTRAIEVIAMFEDSIVDVTHLDDPKPGRITRTTTALLASGGVALAAAIGLFLRAVVQAAHLRSAWALWDAQGKAHAEFPLPRGGVGADLLVLVLLTFGVYALLDGLRRSMRERTPRDYTVGPAAHASHSAPADLVPVAAFPLVQATGEGWQLHLLPHMTGQVTLGDTTLPLAEWATPGAARRSPAPVAVSHPIADGARIQVTLGLSTFHISKVAAPRRHRSALAVDWQQQAYTAVCAVAAGAFLALIYALPADPKGLALDEFMKDRRSPVFRFNAPEEPQSAFKLPAHRADGSRGADSGGRAKGASGVSVHGSRKS